MGQMGIRLAQAAHELVTPVFSVIPAKAGIHLDTITCKESV